MLINKWNGLIILSNKKSKRKSSCRIKEVDKKRKSEWLTLNNVSDRKYKYTEYELLRSYITEFSMYRRMQPTLISISFIVNNNNWYSVSDSERYMSMIIRAISSPIRSFFIKRVTGNTYLHRINAIGLFRKYSHAIFRIATEHFVTKLTVIKCTQRSDHPVAEYLQNNPCRQLKR